MDIENKAFKPDLVIYSDGGSRGNPGQSACGFIIEDSNGVMLAKGGEYLGITTNNQAEYQGVKIALEKAVKISGENILFRADSLLVINQLKGIYKVKNKELWPIHKSIKSLLKNFKEVRFEHVPREQNQIADGLVNKVLDERIFGKHE